MKALKLIIVTSIFLFIGTLFQMIVSGGVSPDIGGYSLHQWILQIGYWLILICSPIFLVYRKS